MRVVVSSQGENLDAPASPVFGRCPTYVFVDSETMDFEAMPNPASTLGSGAGVLAAKFVVKQGAEVVLTGNLGPNASDVLQAVGVPGYLTMERTIRQMVEAFKMGQLQAARGASVAAHAGMSAAVGARRRLGGGTGGSRGMGSGTPAALPLNARSAARESELSALKDKLADLRQQLAETMERIERLEEES